MRPLPDAPGYGEALALAAHAFDLAHEVSDPIARQRLLGLTRTIPSAIAGAAGSATEPQAARHLADARGATDDARSLIASLRANRLVAPARSWPIEQELRRLALQLADEHVAVRRASHGTQSVPPAPAPRRRARVDSTDR